MGAMGVGEQPSFLSQPAAFLVRRRLDPHERPCFRPIRPTAPRHRGGGGCVPIRLPWSTGVIFRLGDKSTPATSSPRGPFSFIMLPSTHRIRWHSTCFLFVTLFFPTHTPRDVHRECVQNPASVIPLGTVIPLATAAGCLAGALRSPPNPASSPLPLRGPSARRTT